VNDHHAQSHTVASHSDTSATGAELNTLTGGGDTTLHDHAGISENTSARHAASHTGASHSDISATGAEINSACDGASAKNSHTHTHASTTSKGVNDHHSESHTGASHSDISSTGAAIDAAVSASHSNATDHAESHTGASHSDISATGTEINTVADGSTAKNSHTHESGSIAHSATTGRTVNDHHAESHTGASHSDISATGSEIDDACDGSTAKNSHTHTTMPAFTATGNIQIDVASGDPRLIFDTSGADRFSIGVDDSDGDKFKISNSASLTSRSEFEIDPANKQIVMNFDDSDPENNGVGLILRNTNTGPQESPSLIFSNTDSTQGLKEWRIRGAGSTMYIDYTDDEWTTNDSVMYIGLSSLNIRSNGTTWQPTTTNQGQMKLFTWQDDSLADNETIDLPSSTDGFLLFSIKLVSDGSKRSFIGAIGNNAHIQVNTDYGHANIPIVYTETDGNFCVFDNGSAVRLKNMMGSNVAIRLTYWYQ